MCDEFVRSDAHINAKTTTRRVDLRAGLVDEAEAMTPPGFSAARFKEGASEVAAGGRAAAPRFFLKNKILALFISRA